MSKEIWKDIKGFDGVYKISNKGRVKSYNRANQHSGYRDKPQILSFGSSREYNQVTLFKNRKRHYRKVHRLVAEAFIPNPDDKPQVNHIDSDPTNNHEDNLEWVTCAENVAHSMEKGNFGSNAGKVTEDEVQQIRNAKRLGFTFEELAEAYDVHSSTIQRIVYKTSWKHV